MHTVPAEEALARRLLSTIRDQAIFALDTAGRVLSWSPGAEQVTGYAATEVEGRHFSLFYAEEEIGLGAPGRELRIAERDGKVEVEGWQLRKGGSRFWAAVTTTALREGTGPVTGYARHVRDVTELRRAEEALRLSEAKFSGIVSIASDAIVSVDESQRIVLFNRGAEQTFGWTEAEVLGQPLEILIPERFRGGHADHVRRFGDGPVVARRMGERREIWALHRDGSEFPAEASISRLEITGMRFYTAVLRDVSARREAEREIQAALEREREARGEAEAAARARDEVLRVVSHDLGNPLSAVLVATSVLMRTLPDEPWAEAARGHVASIRELGRQMQHLREDLLDVASIEAGHLSVVAAPRDPAVLVEEVARQLAGVAEEKGVALEAEVEEGLPQVPVDRERMLQVLSNLVGNAIKFTPEGGRIVLRAGRSPGGVVLSVADTGPGIAPEHLPHVFDRFWKTAQGNRQGAGLGLAIARGIVEAHGGTLRAESEPGRGSTFYVELPAAGDRE